MFASKYIHGPDDSDDNRDTNSGRMEMIVEETRPDSADLTEVQRLWRAHSNTLGFFPDGAFRQHAERGWVLVAKERSTGVVLGYLIYRVARGHAVVVHLCVDDAYQGYGVARRLIRELRGRTANLLGARLACRLDFPASDIWNRLGFVRRGSRAAREAGKHLGCWYMDYGHPDLFSRLAEDKTIAVMDANVFFDLVNDDESRRSLQAKSLRADWLEMAFALAVTPELQTEISRNPDITEQRRRRAFAGTFIEVKASPEQVEDALISVENFLGRGNSESDRSDRRQLAHAIASEAEIFLTCDRDLIDNAEVLESRCGIRVLEPVALINDIDASEQPAAYSPARLDGSRITSRQMRADDLDAIKQAFLYFAQAESLAGLPRVLRELLAQPRTSRVHILTDSNGALVAVFGVDRADSQVHRVRALRIRGSGVSQTLARHLLWRAISDAAAVGAQSIIFDDPFSDDRMHDALMATGFVRDGDHWIKLVLREVVNPERLASVVSAFLRTASITSVLRDDLVETVKATQDGDATDIARLEHLLWPLKVETATIPCYIVPIRPTYAADLFDTGMASESLFAADAGLLLRLENVYYRSARPMLKSPARVLWYVSKEQGYSHAGYISAASTITSVATGDPRTLYTRYRRYGTYKYDDVLRIGNRAMAFTFGQTEILTAPISFAQIGQVLQRHTGAQNPLAGPVGVPVGAWFELYSKSTTRHG
jgi:ribosomal protein S18 acetylase RimI-like enzyme/predicted nucleic acid-binding protein